MMQTKSFSIRKFEPNTINEDAVIANPNVIAVSDGAGGVYAECWSRYLLDRLPNKPITCFAELDNWIDSIYEKYYDESEQKAKAVGGMFLDKFYDEGSFATLVAVWHTQGDTYPWMSYGDSVAFCYNRKSRMLQHTFTELADFNNPPYLLNCNNPLTEQGCRCGEFHADKDCVIFVASDTLAHYLLMLYEIEHQEVYQAELKKAIDVKTKNSNLIESAQHGSMLIDTFIEGILQNKSRRHLQAYLHDLEKKHLLGHDDYSLALFCP